MLLASLIFLIVIHLLAFVGPLFWTVSPEAADPLNSLAPPSLSQPLGSDDLGRDELSRILYGGRVTLLVGFAAMATSVVLGSTIGALGAFYGGWTDRVLMRLTDALMAVPNFFLIVVAVTVVGTGPLTLILVIGATSWMQVARVVYGETLRWKTSEFVTAAEACGASRARLLWRHVLPQANMLQNAQQYVWTAPTLAVYPGVAITLVVLAYNFLGDGLRDVLDPRLRT